MRLFGFQIGRESEEKEEKSVQTFVQESKDDVVELSLGSSLGYTLDLDGQIKSEQDLITRYREMGQHPECDAAITDICNEAISYNEKESCVRIVMDEVDSISDATKKKINDEFEYLLNLLNFKSNGYEIFRKWYEDGRIYYHKMIDTSAPKKGIVGLRYIDPRFVKKVRKPRKQERVNNFEVDKKYKPIGYDEFFVFTPGGSNKFGTKSVNLQDSLKIAKDSIAYIHSGIFDSKNKTVLSHLHKAIRTFNQLRMLEDAVVIYRITRAPERRIFYIDVGNLPKMKAEQYLRDMMVKHKNKLTYDASTGEVKDARKYMTMLEDFWLPRREGGRGTEITNLPSGQNLGEIEDVEYFRRKLYKSLNVPITRLDAENSFNLGRGSEITRDEVKFSKFIHRLRSRFTQLFDDLLETQLILKGILTRKEWKELKNEILYDFVEDNHFTELKENEILSGRLAILNEIEGYTHKYFSKEWVQKNILRFSDEQIKEMNDQIDKEQTENPEQEFGKDSDSQEEEPPPATNSYKY